MSSVTVMVLVPKDLGFKNGWVGALHVSIRPVRSVGNTTPPSLTLWSRVDLRNLELSLRPCVPHMTCSLSNSPVYRVYGLSLWRSTCCVIVLWRAARRAVPLIDCLGWCLPGTVCWRVYPVEILTWQVQSFHHSGRNKTDGKRRELLFGRRNNHLWHAPSSDIRQMLICLQNL